MDIRMFERKNIKKGATDVDYVRSKTLHDILVGKIFGYLMEKNDPWEASFNNIILDTEIYLTTGEIVIPDITNLTKKIVYEVHVKGLRKEKYFDKLPEDWKGVNVFYDEKDREEALIIQLGSNEIQKISWKIKEDSIMVPIYIMELLYGTIVNVDSDVINKEQIRKCLEILNKYHDKIEGKIGEE